MSARKRVDIIVKPSSYHPTRAELEEDISIPVTPDELAKAIVTGGAPRRNVKRNSK